MTFIKWPQLHLKLTSVILADLKEYTAKVLGLLGRDVLCVLEIVIGSVLEEAMSCYSKMQRNSERGMEKLTHLDTGEENKQLLEPRELKMQLVGQGISPITQSGCLYAVA